MYDELKKLSQATLAGIQGANTDAGTGDAIVNDFARSNFRDAIASSTNVGAMAATTAAAEEERAKAARAAEAEKIRNKLDPSKYQRVRKEDGGFDFLDGDGNRIDIKRYAEVTGLRPSDILKDSDNPLDQQYVNDYSNTKGVIDAIQQGDSDTLQGFLRENQSIDPNMKPEDLMRELIRKYPHIYGNGKYQDTFNNASGKSLFKFNTGGAAATGTGISSSDYGY